MMLKSTHKTNEGQVEQMFLNKIAVQSESPILHHHVERTLKDMYEDVQFELDVSGKMSPEELRDLYIALSCSQFARIIRERVGEDLFQLVHTAVQSKTITKLSNGALKKIALAYDFLHQTFQFGVSHADIDMMHVSEKHHLEDARYLLTHLDYHYHNVFLMLLGRLITDKEWIDQKKSEKYWK